jgi:RNA polymerase sigma-70 factor (ECF subfamily)
MSDPGSRDPTPSTDAELARIVARAGAGAAGEVRQAEAELCRRFAGRIRLYGLKHLGTEERARDLVQSVLLVLIEALRSDKVEAPEHLDRFVLGTCRHMAQRIRHADRKATPTEVADLDVIAVLPPADHLDFGALLRCVGQLDDRARAVVQLSFYRERSADEIAGVLEMTSGNVRVVRHRAVSQLRQCLEDPMRPRPRP